MATLYTRTIGSVTDSGDTITLKLVCTYTQSNSNNSSSVSIYVRAECTANDWPFKLASWQITGNGPTGTGGESTATTGTRNMTTKSKTITHLTDGSQTFSSGAKVTLTYYSSGWISQSFTLANKSYALPTINVYPSLSFSPATPNMSSSVTMNITKPSSSAFTATGVKIVAIYDSTTTDIYEGTGASTTWAIPDLASTTPTDTKAITIKIQSYRGTTYYAAKEYTLNAKVPAAYVPSCAIDTITDNYNFSSFIAGYSLLTIALDSGTAGSGATIVSYSIEVRDTDASGAVIYSATNTTTAATTSFTMTNAIQSTATYIKATITDSRGRTGTATQTVSAVAYMQPQITLTAERCDSGGVADPLGAYAKIFCTWSITQIGSDNKLMEKVRIYKSTDGSTFSQIDERYVPAGTYSESYFVITALATNTQGYFYAQTRDNVSPRVRSSTKIVPRSILPLSLYDDGNDVGVTMGEAATSSGFNCKLPSNFLVNGAMGGTLADYVIEDGTDGDWTYRKWASGKAECWLNVEHTANSWSSWGSGLYYNAGFSTPAYPLGLFTGVPAVTVGLQKKTTDGNGLKMLATSTLASSTSYGSVRIVGANTKTETFYITIHAIGRWQ